MSKYENCVQAAMAQWRNFLNISIMKNETEVFVMKDKTYHAYLDSHERQLVIHSLVELKNRLIQEGRYTDCVDELIFKVVNTPSKKIVFNEVNTIPGFTSHSRYPNMMKGIGLSFAEMLDKLIGLYVK